MKTQITPYPSSYLTVELNEGEEIITEKGALIYAQGEYSFQNKLEIKSLKSWIAKLFGKSLAYNIYTAKDTKVRLAFAPKGTAELFNIDVEGNTPILFEPSLHFARSNGLKLQLQSQGLKTTLNDGMKLKTCGSGSLFLKGYGRIIKQSINSNTPIYLDEEALIAFEESLEVKTVSKGVKELISSGEGYLLSVTGKGNLWLQSRNATQTSGSGGIIEGVFNFLT